MEKPVAQARLTPELATLCRHRVSVWDPVGSSRLDILVFLDVHLR